MLLWGGGQNGGMNAFQSYLRHLIVTGIVLLVEKTKLPIEGAAEAAEVISLLLVGTVTWYGAKYAPQLMKGLPKAEKK